MNVQEMSDKLKAAVIQAATERATPVRFSFWPNGNRREGKNDAQFTGRVTISVLALGEILANAIKAGTPEVELWGDLWQNEPSQTAGGTDRPMLSGKARNLVQPKGTSEQPANDAGAPAEAQAATG